MGLIAFCGFVLPWGALALWLYLTQIKPYHTGVPWRPLTDYIAPGDDPRRAPERDRPPEPLPEAGVVPPGRPTAALTGPGGGRLH